MEIWKDIKGYEGIYHISNLGNVKSTRKNKEIILKQTPDKDGYLKICLCKNNIKKNYIVHRLVAFSFVDFVLGKDYVNHKNGIKYDNRFENLEWCTITENNQHAFRTGLNVSPKGEDHYKIKLNNNIVLAIRNSNKKQREIAEEFNISQQTVSEVLLYKIWKHI